MDGKMKKAKRTLSRRVVLRGIGGVALTMPVLEGLAPQKTYAQDENAFAVFFRQGNGVAQSHRGPLGDEPERFWPSQLGALTEQTMNGRAVDELAAYRNKLLMVRGTNQMVSSDVGCGHARGGLTHLTAQEPTSSGQGNNSQAAGESIDHRIGRELNPAGRESLCLYARGSGSYLGGYVMSYRGPGDRRSPIESPWQAYQTIVGAVGDGLGEGGGTPTVDPEVEDRLVRRRQSVNDLVRTQLQRLQSNSRLSSQDKQRLDLHMSSIRDLERTVMEEMPSGCGITDPSRIEQESAGFGNSQDVPRIARLHMEVAAMAIACGYTRSVAVQMGNGNDSTRYTIDGQLQENFHYISHRRYSHGSDGAIFEGSDVLHHKIDRLFAQTFRHLLDRLDAYQMPGGGTLLDQGMAIWTNDLANPGHGGNNMPWVIAGGAGGYLKQGQYVDAGGVGINRILNTFGTAAGVRKSGGGVLDDFGKAGLSGGLIPEMLA